MTWQPSKPKYRRQIHIVHLLFLRALRQVLKHSRGVGSKYPSRTCIYPNGIGIYPNRIHIYPDRIVIYSHMIRFHSIETKGTMSLLWTLRLSPEHPQPPPPACCTRPGYSKFAYTYIVTQIHTCIYICVCLHIYVYVYILLMHICIYIYIYTYIYMYIHMHVCLHVCLLVHVHTCMGRQVLAQTFTVGKLGARSKGACHSLWKVHF